MDRNSIAERILTLTKELNEHNRRYYVENSPTISDYEFDLLLQELIHLEELYPEFIQKDSPTQKVGSDLDSASQHFKSYPHKYPMLSLANTYNLGELREFDQRVRKLATESFTYNCELKFDGTGINLLYKNGILLRALTRGDGSVGDDVLRNVRSIKDIPLKLKEDSGYPSEFEIRGEIYMPFEAFDILNLERERQEEPLFANPRNAAAGSLKILDSKIAAKRGLHCVLYHLISNDLQIETQSQSLLNAQSWGLPISSYSKECKDIEEVVEFVNYWDTKRHELPFPTDGIVVKVNQFSVQKSLGYTAKTPRWAVAYKFKPEEALTKVLSIDYQVGRTGAVTPVANLEPVLLSGTTVKRATLHNADQMRLLDIRIGDYVYIEKGGEIIPKITSVELKKRDIDTTPAIFPTNCPVCGSPLVKDEDEAKYFCPNTDGCAPQIEGAFIHFCSRKALNINVGEIAIDQMYQRGFIRRLEDLYSLSDLQLLSLDKWKEKSVENFRKSLEQSKEIPFSKVLYALGIKHIGETTAKTLTSKFNSIEALMNADKNTLLEVEDVGEKLADSIISYFANQQNIKTIEVLRENGLKFEQTEQKPLSNQLSGMTIMITGNYSIPRETMKLYIEAHGGKVGSSVSSSTTYLLAGDKAGEAKIKKAEKLGIPIISEEEFYKIALGGEQEKETMESFRNQAENNDSAEPTLF